MPYPYSPVRNLLSRMNPISMLLKHGTPKDKKMSTEPLSHAFTNFLFKKKKFTIGKLARLFLLIWRMDYRDQISQSDQIL